MDAKDVPEIQNMEILTSEEAETKLKAMGINPSVLSALHTV